MSRLAYCLSPCSLAMFILSTFWIPLKNLRKKDRANQVIMYCHNVWVNYQDLSSVWPSQLTTQLHKYGKEMSYESGEHIKAMRLSLFPYALSRLSLKPMKLSWALQGHGHDATHSQGMYYNKAFCSSSFPFPRAVQQSVRNFLSSSQAPRSTQITGLESN